MSVSEKFLLSAISGLSVLMLYSALIAITFRRKP